MDGLAPMPDLDLSGPVRDYRTYVASRLPGLLRDSQRLADDLDAGRMSEARTDWLPAHLDYERLGAAYNTFEDVDGAIDGTAAGRPDGVRDPSWTGFFRIEYGLWHGQTPAQLRPLGRRLVSDVRGLIRDFPSEDTDPADLPLRTHEILENSLQFQLSGADDYGSGTTVATLGANVDGTRAVLATITPLIRARDPHLLAAIDAGLATVTTDVAAYRSAGGTWTSVAHLPIARKQQLDSDLGAVLENLSAIPNLLMERTSA